jgi:hypothetical protein
VAQPSPWTAKRASQASIQRRCQGRSIAGAPANATCNEHAHHRARPQIQADRFWFKGWVVSIEVAGDKTMFSGRTHLHVYEEHKHRIVLATSRSEQAATRQALDSKARDFVEQWIARSQAGTAADSARLGSPGPEAEPLRAASMAVRDYLAQRS